MDQYAVNALWQMSDVEAGTHAAIARLIDPILTTLRIDEGEAIYLLGTVNFNECTAWVREDIQGYVTWIKHHRDDFKGFGSAIMICL